jgi:hypothetical protein
MCKASTLTFTGSETLRTSVFCELLNGLCQFKMRYTFQQAETLLRSIWIAFAAFFNYRLRHKKLEPIAMVVPPFATDLLIGGSNEIAARS